MAFLSQAQHGRHLAGRRRLEPQADANFLQLLRDGRAMTSELRRQLVRGGTISVERHSPSDFTF